jgi:hypothetical protein
MWTKNNYPSNVKYVMNTDILPRIVRRQLLNKLHLNLIIIGSSPRKGDKHPNKECNPNRRRISDPSPRIQL